MADDFSNMDYEHINEEEIAKNVLDDQARQSGSRSIQAEYECKVIQALSDAGDHSLVPQLEAQNDQKLLAEKEMKSYAKASTTPKKDLEQQIVELRRAFLINAATGAEQQHAAMKAVAAVRKEAGLPYADYDSNMRNWYVRAQVAKDMLKKLPKPADPEPTERTNAGNDNADKPKAKKAKRAAKK